MERAEWVTYDVDEISPMFQGRGRIAIINLDEGKASSVSQPSYKGLGMLVAMGNEGTLFEGVDSKKVGGRLTGNGMNVDYATRVSCAEKILLKPIEEAQA